MIETTRRKRLSNGLRAPLSWAVIAIALASCSKSANADPTPLSVAAIFQDHAVLQRDRPNAVWGQASPGATVAISLDGRTVSAKTGGDGRWRADLPAHAAGGPYELTVESGGQKQTFSDILVGDVWLCSGQSNMEFKLAAATNAGIEIAAANDASLRLLEIEHVSRPAPQAAPGASSHWLVSDADSAAAFSAVCYFLGRELRKETDAPVGLIDASWGGSIIQDWIDPATLKALGGYDQGLSILAAYARSPKEGEQRMRSVIDQWASAHEKDASQWNAATVEDSNWKMMEPNGFWEGSGVAEFANFNGTAWFRTTFTLSEDQTAQDARLVLGPIDDIDTTWVNGVRIGDTQIWDKPRDYSVPQGVLRAGENVIAVRVIDTGGGGGLWGDPADKKLILGDGEEIGLGPQWRYRIAASLRNSDIPPRTPWTGGSGLTTLYNGMIAPLTPYGLRGFVWYQGESNVAEADEYARLMPALVRSWRTVFELPDAPFLETQLANFGAFKSEPDDSAWAELRDVQRRVAEVDPNVGMAVTIDIGDPRDIHPTQKKEVGRRLSLEAMRIAYSDSDSSLVRPSPAKARRNGDAVVVSFAGAPGGLFVTGGNRPVGFELCDAQNKCAFADARADGGSIQLAVPPGMEPRVVRYAWADSPVTNLVDAQSLPVTPFEIDIAE